MLRVAGGIHIVSGRIVVEAEFDTGAAARRLRSAISELYGFTADMIMVNGSGIRRGTRYLLRLVSEGPDDVIRCDLTWRGSYPALLEEPHLLFNRSRPTLDAQRLTQVGTWEGTLVVDGTEMTVDPASWQGARDRSWGIRPVGEPEPPGRNADEPFGGIWWIYAPFRFETFSLILILQEDADGYRTLNDARRVFTDGRVEQLGWPRVDIRYRSGTRHPEHCGTF